MLFITDKQKEKIKNYIIFEILFKIKKPVPVKLKAFWWAFFNAHLNKPTRKYLIIFFKYYQPILKLKVATHLIFESQFTEIAHKHCVHSFIAGCYNLLFVYHYLFWMILLYFLKKNLLIYLKHRFVRIFIRVSITETQIINCLKLNFNYNNV